MKFLRHILKRLRLMKSNRRKKLHGDWRNNYNTCFMGHKTKGRAKYEIVNMMINSAYLTSTNTKNHITIPVSTHSYRAAFNRRIVLNALSKLMYTAAWLCNQCFLQSALVVIGAVIYNDLGVVSPNWRKWLE